ncbi:non-homologous end-joining DNA ligase [soil metagenome]
MGLKMESIKIKNRFISLSHLDKIWFPRSKITKGAIVSYYAQMAKFQVPIIKNHLLSMQRYPDGIKGEAFYQKNASAYFPAWIKKFEVTKSEGGTVDYVVATNEQTLVYLVNQATLTLHYWLSKYTKLHYPDRIIFDLDPSVNNFSRIKSAAFLVKAICDELGLPCYAMTTGSRGMHIYIPLKPGHTFEEVDIVASYIARRMIAQKPKEFTLEVRINKRGTKIFIDTLRNRYNATAVVPYSVRAYEKAPVAMPLWWDEIDTRLTAQTFTIANAYAHLKKVGNPWKTMNAKAVSLKRLIKKIGDS